MLFFKISKIQFCEKVQRWLTPCPPGPEAFITSIRRSCLFSCAEHTAVTGSVHQTFQISHFSRKFELFLTEINSFWCFLSGLEAQKRVMNPFRSVSDQFQCSKPTKIVFGILKNTRFETSAVHDVWDGYRFLIINSIMSKKHFFKVVLFTQHQWVQYLVSRRKIGRDHQRSKGRLTTNHSGKPQSFVFQKLSFSPNTSEFNIWSRGGRSGVITSEAKAVSRPTTLANHNPLFLKNTTSTPFNYNKIQNYRKLIEYLSRTV